MVGDKVEEVKWQGLGVNDQWQQMKGIMMETAQDICGMTNGPHKHACIKTDKIWHIKSRKSEPGNALSHPQVVSLLLI